VFSWSYATLSTAAARLFRLLGLHLGPDITAAAAGSLADCTLPAVRVLLAELTGASLLIERVPGRYTSHDLLRVYAAELTHDLDTDHERHAATRRMLDHYLHTAGNADRLLNRARDPIPLPLEAAAPGTTTEDPIDHAAAKAWLTAEQQNLLAAVEQAVALGLDTHAWQLAWTLDTFLYRQDRWPDLTATWQTALAAAGRLHDPSAQAYAHRTLARVATRLGRDQDARTQLHHALDLYSQAGDLAGQACTHQILAMLWERQHMPDRALDHARQGLELCEAAGHRRGQAAASNAVGWYQAVLGDHQQALAFCRRALTLYQQLGDRDGEAHTWDSLGYAYHLARQPQAVDCYRQALALFHEIGDRYHEAASLAGLGDTHSAAGDRTAANAARQRALGILSGLRHTEAKALRQRLTQLLPTRLDDTYISSEVSGPPDRQQLPQSRLIES
jgi:tetratricopeptide (TPR) repeat protein